MRGAGDDLDATFGTGASYALPDSAPQHPVLAGQVTEVTVVVRWPGATHRKPTHLALSRAAAVRVTREVRALTWGEPGSCPSAHRAQLELSFVGDGETQRYGYEAGCDVLAWLTSSPGRSARPFQVSPSLEADLASWLEG